MIAVVWFTFSVKACVPVPCELLAVIVMGYAPPVAAVPLSTPLVEFNDTPLGNVPVSLNVGAG